MLREIELSHLLLRNATLKDRSVALHLPVSKVDTRGAGATVTLLCSCDHSELGAKLCPFHQALRFIELRTEQTAASGEEDPYLFATPNGEPLAKAAFVAEWQALAPPGHEQLGGHSARRSGAKWCARLGWPLATTQKVGRWAGSTVLEYVEEALHELPVGLGGA